MLLKPWRCLQEDLKQPTESWSEAFSSFLSDVPREIHDVLSSIQYLHECRTAATQDHDSYQVPCSRGRFSHNDPLDDEDDEGVEDDGPVLNEENLELIIRAQSSLEEQIHGQLAIEVAKCAKIFRNDSDQDEWATHPEPEHRVANATGDDLRRLAEWQNQLEADVARMNSLETLPPTSNNESAAVQRIAVDANSDNEGPCVNSLNKAISQMLDDNVLCAADPSTLNEDQRRAYNIIVWHLDETLAGRRPPPLRLIIHGEGGTGKSKVLQTVSDAFRHRACQNRLIKAAYTGVAASLIDGKTTHIVGGISLTSEHSNLDDPVSEEVKKKLEGFWNSYDYLAIDEMSMIAKDFFASLARNIGIGKKNPDGTSFGGINVIILGDFLQFPPVARPIRDALYYPSNAETDTLQSQIGRAIYEEFTMVVTLKEQKRITDPIWHEFLQHMRKGTVKDSHLRMLHSLVVGKHASNLVDFSTDPWNTAALVTPRHAVRNQWNAAALRKMCRETGRQIFVCTADDTTRGRPLSIKEKCCLEAHRGRTRKQRRRAGKDLPYRVEIALGMKVMVTDNLETDLDITNGARGEIVGIVLDKDEPPVGDSPVVKLKHLPAYILVKLSRTRATRLDGLEDCVIPVQPTATNYRIKIATNDGKSIQRTIRRAQFPITAAYAFTDYRSQGQTIPYVLVDIAPPPTGGLNLFNLYVALSRSSGRDTIRLLRDFDDASFKRGHAPELMMEMDRLDELDRQTKSWYKAVVRRDS